MKTKKIEYGWFLPTMGDASTGLNDPDHAIEHNFITGPLPAFVSELYFQEDI